MMRSPGCPHTGCAEPLTASGSSNQRAGRGVGRPQDRSTIGEGGVSSDEAPAPKKRLTRIAPL